MILVDWFDVGSDMVVFVLRFADIENFEEWKC